MGHSISSPDQVAQALLDGVKSGRYVPGQRLIEADLTRELTVSRGPVREALKRLAADGIVRLIAHRGAYIGKLTRHEVHDILVIQETLTGLAARLGAEHIGRGDNQKRFKDAYRRLMDFTDRADSLSILDERARFYDTLVEIGGNRQLHRFVPIPQTDLLRTQFRQHMTERDRDRQFKEYETIARHILAGNAQSAETAMQRHIRNTRLRIERLPDGVFAPGV